MATAPPYMPDAQADFDTWLVNFSTLITAEPFRYGLLPADAAAIDAVTAEWTAAFAPVTSKATKTPQAVAAKNTARIRAEAIVRHYAQTVANNPGVSADSKIALGLNSRTNGRTPITAPVTCPVLAVQSAGKRVDHPPLPRLGQRGFQTGQAARRGARGGKVVVAAFPPSVPS